MAKLKVFSGGCRNILYDADGNDKYGRHVVIATTSQKKVAEKLEISMNEVRHHWSITANQGDVADALKHPEKLVIYRSDHYGDREIVDIADSLMDNWRRHGKKKG